MQIFPFLSLLAICFLMGYFVEASPKRKGPKRVVDGSVASSLNGKESLESAYKRMSAYEGDFDPENFPFAALGPKEYNNLFLKACTDGFFKLVRVLIDAKKVDRFATNGQRENCLSLAVKGGHVEIAKLYSELPGPRNDKDADVKIRSLLDVSLEKNQDLESARILFGMVSVPVVTLESIKNTAVLANLARRGYLKPIKMYHQIELAQNIIKFVKEDNVVGMVDYLDNIKAHFEKHYSSDCFIESLMTQKMVALDDLSVSNWLCCKESRLPFLRKVYAVVDDESKKSISNFCLNLFDVADKEEKVDDKIEALDIQSCNSVAEALIERTEAGPFIENTDEVTTFDIDQSIVQGGSSVITGDTDKLNQGESLSSLTSSSRSDLLIKVTMTLCLVLCLL